MADFKRTKDSWGSNADDPTIRSSTSIKPDPSKLIWYGSQYEDQLYGTPQSFSFVDVHATLILPFIPGQGVSQTCSLPGLSLISLSEHRDTYPVVSLGRRGIKGFTTGHRTTAGTLAFTVFGEMPFAEAIRKYAIWRGSTSNLQFHSPDELPPFDLSLVFMSEKGYSSTLLLRSIKILDRSQNVSVRDIQLTEVFSFMAANCSYFIKDPELYKIEPESKITPQARNQWLVAKPVTSNTTTTTTSTTTITEPTLTRTTTSTTSTSTTPITTTGTSTTATTATTVTTTSNTTTPVPSTTGGPA